jgi:subtilisin family serine protease
MVRRGMAVTLAMAGLIAACATPVFAQAISEQERLKRLLENKYGAPRSRGMDQGSTGRPDPGTTGNRTRSLGSPAPAAGGAAPSSGDVVIIRPDGSVTSMTPGRRSDAAPESLGARIGRALIPQAKAQQPMAAPSRGSPTMVSRDTFVIQLSPNATEQQIDALVQKYDLKVVRSAPSLGVLYVQQNEAAKAKTRSLAPAQETVKSALEPKVIQDLRKEPAVDAAFVNTTVGPKSVPRPSTLKLNQSGSTFNWDWHEAGATDGNWGLKSLRMPAVWSIVSRARDKVEQTTAVNLAFLDTGFGQHKNLAYAAVNGTLPPLVPPVKCENSHGTHVAGIAGAKFNQGLGMDGMMPNARVIAVPVTHELLSAGATDGSDPGQQHVAYFMDAIIELADYLEDYPVGVNERRVVNLSLAYNWLSVSLLTNRKPTDDAAIRDQVRQHGKVVQRLVTKHQDRVLFVAAAGNDSALQPTPVGAEYATAFAFAALQQGGGQRQVKNVIIVEARGRDGKRAEFSNVGGHVSAPGVDIMSTVASADSGFALCSGTSQAAPHVTALAGMLFELNPAKTPAEIIDIIVNTALPPLTPGAAPRVDALEAVLRVAPDPKVYLRHLADLNGDGKVDAADLAIFKDHLVAIEAAKTSDEPFSQDLNGDGVVDNRERCFPRIDLNGSGRASYDPSDMRPILGVPRSDLDVMELAWTGATDFKTALQESGLADLISAWKSTSSIRSLAPVGTKLPCN